MAPKRQRHEDDEKQDSQSLKATRRPRHKADEEQDSQSLKATKRPRHKADEEQDSQSFKATKRPRHDVPAHCAGPPAHLRLQPQDLAVSRRNKWACASGALAPPASGPCSAPPQQIGLLQVYL